MSFTFKSTGAKKKAPKQTAKHTPRARVQVTRETRHDDDHVEEEILKDEEQAVNLPDREFDQPAANVGFQCSLTKNLGDFNSLKVGVSIHIPCYTHEVHETFELSKKFVDEKLNETMNGYLEDIARQNGGDHEVDHLAEFQD
ncbi:hypothetical protein S1R3X_000066 [Vibrio phage vB_ValS_VA-RY-4]|nr:hypothetical protein S1R3X_000066 [Vibrio phage vB_ValS_VA-RY-4]WGH28456.1 hypothetical protein 13VO501A_gene0073 [Vibrio phage 13VO501A]